MRGSIFWVLLVSGWFLVSKTIIPEAREHFLVPSARWHIHPFGGLGLRLNVIKGDDAIMQLSEWYELLRTEGIWDQPGVHMADLDEASNKLYVGVTSHHDVAGVEAFLDRVSIYSPTLNSYR